MKKILLLLVLVGLVATVTADYQDTGDWSHYTDYNWSENWFHSDSTTEPSAGIATVQWDVTLTGLWIQAGSNRSNLTYTGQIKKCSGNQTLWDELGMCWDNSSCINTVYAYSGAGTNHGASGLENWTYFNRVNDDTYEFQIFDFNAQLGTPTEETMSVLKFGGHTLDGYDSGSPTSHRYWITNMTYDYGCQAIVTTTTTTTTTLVDTYECTTNNDCDNSTEACIGGVCTVVPEAQCVVDFNCGADFWCNTYDYTKQYAHCEYKKPVLADCLKNHECFSDLCTSHSINPADEYPDSPSGYIIGFCYNASIELCNQTSECTNPVDEYCNIISTGHPLGYCDPRTGEGLFCESNDECEANMSCFDGTCQYVNFTGGQCDPYDFTRYENITQSADIIWPDCNGKSTCTTDYDCFCDRLNATFGGCTERATTGESCELLACNINDNCMGFVCVPESWECKRNRLANGSMIVDTYFEEYCPDGEYCDLVTHQCTEEGESGDSCINYWECPAGYDCVAGTCVFSPPTTTVTTVTLPPTTQESLVVESGKDWYLRNEGVNILRAFYNFLTAPIEEANCIYYLSDSVFSRSSGTLSWYEGGGYYQLVDNVYVKDTAPTGLVNITVWCSKANYHEMINYTTVEIKSTYGDLSWSAYPPSSYTVGDNIFYSVLLRNISVDTISGASCTLYVDGFNEGSLSDTGNGLYTDHYALESTGVHDFNVTCTASETGTVSIKTTITGTDDDVEDTCNNGVWDIGEEHVDCGGICPATCDEDEDRYDHCENGVQDDDETDVDCGGSDCESCGTNFDCDDNYDCETGWCHPELERCRNPSCNDGYQNGDESGIDCGGSCPVACECGDCFALTGCDSSGFESCNCTSGKCVEWYCLDNSQCPELFLWNDDKTGKVLRSRVCIENECKFTSDTPYHNSSTAMTIYPLSGVVILEGSDYLYLGVCEKDTHGVRIVTSDMTHRQYRIVTSSKTPAIPPTSSWEYFGSDGTDDSETMPELCDYSGTGYRYALIMFHAEKDGGLVSSEFVEMKIEKTLFEVNETPSTTYDNGVVFDLSRNGTCWIRPNSLTPYTNVSASGGDYFDVDFFGILDTTSVEYMCNSTYDEKVTGVFSKSGSWLILWFLGIIWSVVFGWVEWKPWYLLIIVFVALIILPLLILLIERERNRGGGFGS